MIDKLSKINAKNISNKTTPDYQTSAEEQDYTLHHKKLINKALKQDIKERKKYAKSIFFLIIGWLVAVFIVLVLQGFGSYLNFTLSENIVITLITGTTINILGIFIIVVNYLFKKQG